MLEKTNNEDVTKTMFSFKNIGYLPLLFSNGHHNVRQKERTNQLSKYYNGNTGRFLKMSLDLTLHRLIIFDIQTSDITWTLNLQVTFVVNVASFTSN